MCLFTLVNNYYHCGKIIILLHSGRSLLKLSERHCGVRGKWTCRISVHHHSGDSIKCRRGDCFMCGEKEEDKSERYVAILFSTRSYECTSILMIRVEFP